MNTPVCSPSSAEVHWSVNGLVPIDGSPCTPRCIMGKRAAPSSSASARPPQGGYKQKLAWAETQSEEPPKKSVIADFLICRWAWGDISTPMVQAIAECATKDGAAGDDLQMLARLGSSGKYKQNMHAELVRNLGESHVSGCLRSSFVPLKIPGSVTIRSVETLVLLPHEVFACLYEHHQEAFMERLLGGSTENIARFWSEMKSHPGFARHPLKDRQDHATKCVPLSIHGDGVAVSGVGRSWGKSVDVYSWNSMLGRDSTLVTNFLSWMMFWKLRAPVQGMDAFDKLSKLFCWSLYWLFIGVWPKRDVSGRPITNEKAGRPLAGGFYAAVWSIRADLEHMAKCFGFPYPASTSPCGLCRANLSDIPWTDGRLEAKWRETIWEGPEHATAHPDRHPLWRLPGANIDLWIPDVLHTMHLGCYQYAFGSIFDYLVHNMPGAPAANLEVIWAKVREHYQAQHTQKNIQYANIGG